MQVTIPACQVIGVERFQSKKGTQCGVLSWFDLTEGKVYRAMVFGDDVAILNGVENGIQCTVTLEIRPSRRDFTVEVYMVGVTPVV